MGPKPLVNSNWQPEKDKSNYLGFVFTGTTAANPQGSYSSMQHSAWKMLTLSEVCHLLAYMPSD